MQKVGLDGLPGAEARGLRGWDRERYGTLSILHDDASFDIFTQIADAVGPARAGTAHGAGDRGRRSSTPWAAWWWSGCWRPANHSRPAAWRPTTTPYSPSRNGSTASCSSSTPAAARGSRPPVPGRLSSPYPKSCAIRHQHPRPSARIVSVPTWPRRCWYSTPRPRSCGTSRRASRTRRTHRLWEVAGTAHLDGGFGEGLEGEWQRDFGEVISVPLIEAVAGPPNTLSYDPAANAALRHLWSWMRDGVAPPEQDRVELSAEELARRAAGDCAR